MTARLLLVSAALALGMFGSLTAQRPEPEASRRPLKEFPKQIDDWTGRDTGRFTAAVERVLQADDYINRVYERKAETPISLYVGYHRSQRQGNAIHSPLNCLPGAGWSPVERGRIQISAAGVPVMVNHYVIEKGLDRQVVLYWYQSHGRVVASEYWSKAFSVYDAVRLNRTDAALIRVIAPVSSASPHDMAAMTDRLKEFAQRIFPSLRDHIPL